MSETSSSFFRSTLQSTKDEAEHKILNLRNEARERLRAINNRPCDASPDAILNEIAVVARMLLDITVEQGNLLHASLQLQDLQMN